MNIIQVGPYPLDPSCIKGGVESSVYGLSQALALQDHEVSVFDFPRIQGKDTVDIRNGVYIHRYKNQGKHNQDAIQRVDEILRDIIALHPDIIHVHSTGELSAIVYQALKEYGCKVMLTIHGLVHVEKKNKLRKNFSLKHLYQYIHQSRIEFDAIENSDIAIVDTEYVVLQLHKLLAKKKVKRIPKVHVIPQGINTEYLSLNAHGCGQTILSIGSISERKGHLYLIKAFEQICFDIPEARLIIAGSLADKQYYHSLLDYVAKSPCKEKIEIKVNLSQEQIYQLYQQATIFALHSQEESQGIVFAEAMAVGLPIVATRVGGVPYVVDHNTNGYLSDYKDTNTFAKYLIYLFTNKKMYNQISLHNKSIGRSYSWFSVVNKVEYLYRCL